MTETPPSFLFIFVAHWCRSVQTHRHCQCRSVWTLRHQCRYVLRTVRHWYRSVLGPNCLGSEVSVHLISYRFHWFQTTTMRPHWVLQQSLSYMHHRPQRNSVKEISAFLEQIHVL